MFNFQIQDVTRAVDETSVLVEISFKKPAADATEKQLAEYFVLENLVSHLATKVQS